MKCSILIKQLRKYWKCSLLLSLFLVLTRCIDVDSVDQPSTVQAGELLTAVVNVHIKASEAGAGSRLVVGFLAPKKWHISEHTTMSYTSNFGNGTMSLVPAGVKPLNGSADWSTSIRNKVGIGKNKLRDLEWVAFWTDKTYDIANGDDIHAAIKVETVTGDQNTIVDLGYFAACTTEDLNGDSNPYGFKFATIETTGGTEPLVNFLVPQLAIVDPLQNMDNEITTITFEGSIVATALTGASEVFLCATAYTNDQQVITVCGQEDKEKMTNIGRDRWRIDMWPRDYFNISESQTIDSMKYYFTDKAGNITVKTPDTNQPFLYQFSCQ